MKLLLTAVLLSLPLQDIPAPYNVDKKVGDAMFKIGTRGDGVYMEPLMVPYFKLQKLKGEGVEANGIVKCAVYDRVTHLDEEKGVIFSLTVLRCGNNEYGVSEVEFQYSTDDK